MVIVKNNEYDDDKRKCTIIYNNGTFLPDVLLDI